MTALVQPEARPAPGLLESMTRIVEHRGPDGEGRTFLRGAGAGLDVVSPDDAWNVALGHRRLSILDLSDSGRQPMARGALWVTYNGEIYNYLEVREELEGLGKRFVSGTDTEVLLAAYEEWGLASLERLAGMWGFVLVDARSRRAVLCRDRLGIKPLYTATCDGITAVVSEPKQLRAWPGFPVKADGRAVAAYLRSGFEDARASFFEGVSPVPAGTYRLLDLQTGALGAPVPYWRPEGIEATIADPREAAAAFRPVFERAVRLTLRSDVPVGYALSGGLDSSSIAVTVDALQAGSSSPRHSFTATFPGYPFDERAFVDTVSRTISSTPHFTTPTADGFLKDVDRFLWHHDEPVGSLSQYSAFCVARLTRESGVPVMLNGQGGDEILSGYWQTYFAGLGHLLRDGRWGTLLRLTLPALGPGGNPAFLGQVPRLASRALGRALPDRLMPLRPSVTGPHESPLQRLSRMSYAEWRLFEVRDLTLPRLLKWDDRNFMAFSVEGRYPFLDHHLVELCLRMKTEAFSSKGWTKEPLRLALADRLPKEVARRRSKLAFEAPQDSWMKAGVVADAVDAFLSGDSPVFSVVEPAALRRLQRHVGIREANQALMRAFLLDRWSRVCGVTLS